MLDPEADVLHELAEKQVEHIPKFLCGGDIDGQVTETDLYVPKEEEPLPTGQASNMLIDENGHGILINWDLSKHEDKLEQLQRHERTGTWQFMSSLLLSRHHFLHTIQDDMESFIYIMLYCGLCYLEHNSPSNTSEMLTFIFDHQRHDMNGHLVGRNVKRAMFVESKGILGARFKFFSSPFQTWWEWALVAARQWILYSAPVSAPYGNILLSAQNTKAMSVVNIKLELYDHSKMAYTFIKCLTTLQWPENELHPVDAAPEANGGITISSFVSSNRFKSEHVNEDGAIEGLGKQSQNSRGQGSCGGSGSQHPKKQSTLTHSMATHAGSKSNQG
ncbi:hypothetical protein C0995_000308 [Termitomyces sp. Mi166|nr:hypothetical protein C0995_000308 [Termitomyces sp. Mi166\